jgi:hypothetical protein
MGLNHLSEIVSGEKLHSYAQVHSLPIVYTTVPKNIMTQVYKKSPVGNYLSESRLAPPSVPDSSFGAKQ